MLYTNTYIHIHTHPHVHTFVQTYTYVHTHIHTNTYIYTYIHTQWRRKMPKSGGAHRHVIYVPSVKNQYKRAVFGYMVIYEQRSVSVY